MEKIFLLYRHIRLDTHEPFYIGIGNKKRAYGKYGRSKHWLSIVEKYGYEVEIIFDDLTWKAACEKEREFIVLYGRRDINTGILVNHTDGGEGSPGVVQSKEANEKRRNWSKNRVFSEQTKRLLSEKQLGEKNHMYNRKGINNPTFGLKRSDKTKKKQSDIAKQRGKENNPMFGKKHSDETKEKMRLKRLGVKSSSKKVECFLNNVLISTYNSLQEAAIETKTNLSSLCMCCKGIRKSANGFKWKYV